MQVSDKAKMTLPSRLVLVLTLMASGRAMTLAFIARAGDGGAGDPPGAWLMPLIGDAVVGVAALVVAALLWKRPSPTTWVIAVVWSAVAAFDALAAYVVDVQTPWRDFFMIEIFGRSMFFAAAALHIVIIALLARADVRRHHGVAAALSGTTPLALS